MLFRPFFRGAEKLTATWNLKMPPIQGSKRIYETSTSFGVPLIVIFQVFFWLFGNIPKQQQKCHLYISQSVNQEFFFEVKLNKLCLIHFWFNCEMFF